MKMILLGLILLGGCAAKTDREIVLWVSLQDQDYFTKDARVVYYQDVTGQGETMLFEQNREAYTLHVPYNERGRITIQQHGYRPAVRTVFSGDIYPSLSETELYRTNK